MKVDYGKRTARPPVVMDVTPSQKAQANAKKFQEQTDQYERLVKHFDEMKALRAAQMERLENNSQQEKASRKRRAQERKVNELRSRVAYLRSRVISNKDDKSAAGELAMAKTQLYWTMHAMTSDE